MVYPRRCAGCSRPMDIDPGHVCWECLAAMQIIEHPFCAKCGDPIDGIVEDAYVCSWCVRNEPKFDAARSAVRYRGTLGVVLQSFKYGGVTCASSKLVDLLYACIRTHFACEQFDLVAFVPLYPTKERDRTFNQSRILAAGLAAKLSIPLFAQALRRTRDTPTQTSLNSRARRENVKNAFSVPHPDWIAGRRLLLVDDIMTTGATVAECSHKFRKAGAASVHVATVARG